MITGTLAIFTVGIIWFLGWCLYEKPNKDE